MIKEKILSSFFVLILLIVAIISSINAIGVASSYSGSEFPLEMYPGEEKIVDLELQNWDINEEIVLEGKILQGSEIAFLKESKVKVPYQVKTPVEMVVKIPKNASIGDRYNVKYEFRQVSGKGEGMVSFGSGIIRNFDVVVKKPELKEGKVNFFWLTLIIFGFFILIFITAIIYLLVQRNRVKIKDE